MNIAHDRLRFRPEDFDPKKNLSNIEKHDIDFATAAQIWEGFVFEREDCRRDDGETRVLSLGAIDGRVVFVVYAWRGAKRRLISSRKANHDEQKIYTAALARLEADTQD
jgi:hypothetical protein